jgi:importin-9
MEIKSLEPDQYSSMAVPLKIIKLLVSELCLASGADFSDSSINESDDNSDLSDLEPELTKRHLMFHPKASMQHQLGDVTKFLTDFFTRCERENIANFRSWYGLLSADEKQKVGQTMGLAE